jgi:flagellar hook-basal body complex protein FliE
MIEAIGPISAETRLAQLLGNDDLFSQAAPIEPGSGIFPAAPAAPSPVNFTGNAFEDVLSKAIESLNGVSRAEVYANQLAEKYIHGQAELQDVMVAQAKMNLMAQLAVTTVTSAVNTIKEITQIQI